MIHKVEGIIIRSVDYGEGNKILTLFTKELGKIGLMARGAKKTKSRLSAISQLFTHGYFVIYQGSGLGSISQGDIMNSFAGIRGDLIKTAWSAYIVELTDKLMEDKTAQPFLFEWLKKALSMIDEGKDPEIITRIFELRLLQLVGVQPELRWCAICQNEKARLVGFSTSEGGFLCENCLTQDRYSRVLSEPSIRLLRTFSRMEIDMLGNVELKEETRKHIAFVIRSFMDTYVGVHLKSRNFLDHLHNWGEETFSNTVNEGAGKAHEPDDESGPTDADETIVEED